MTDPLTALFVAGLLALGGAMVFWPRVGMVDRWRSMQRNALRVRIEDALKHLYDCEYRKITCTRQSIAGALSISGDAAASLLARLESLGLIHSTAEGFELTAEGRRYALRVIRMHRLWERYLADETGLDETAWHLDAERREHVLTVQETESLAARLGNPPFDPHGDPIPTAAGELPMRPGIALSQLPPGQHGRIVHVEDEPDEVYAAIVASGLHPGMSVQVRQATSDLVAFEADGKEKTLPPIVAANVTVVPDRTSEPQIGEFETLASLDPGQRAVVVGISRACRGLQRRRLMDLGLVPGTEIAAEMRSAGGDPTAYVIRGALIALRKKQAELIHISRKAA